MRVLAEPTQATKADADRLAIDLADKPPTLSGEFSMRIAAQGKHLAIKLRTAKSGSGAPEWTLLCREVQIESSAGRVVLDATGVDMQSDQGMHLRAERMRLNLGSHQMRLDGAAGSVSLSIGAGQAESELSADSVSIDLEPPRRATRSEGER